MLDPERETTQQESLNELHLFAGGGGGILGGILLGHRPVCAVEIKPYCREILLQRQRDGILPRFPIWDDVRTFDGTPWRGIADIVCGGFPCQDISVAGTRKGLDGERSGLWDEMRRVVCEVCPRFVFVENSPALTYRGLGRVMADLAAMGYDAQWGVFYAADVGAPHLRGRIFILADAGGVAKHRSLLAKDRTKLGWETKVRREDWELFKVVAGVPAGRGRWREMGEPGLVRNNDGLAATLDRLHAVGNGQVPAVVELAWKTLDARLTANVELKHGANNQ